MDSARGTTMTSPDARQPVDEHIWQLSMDTAFDVMQRQRHGLTGQEELATPIYLTMLSALSQATATAEAEHVASLTADLAQAQQDLAHWITRCSIAEHAISAAEQARDEARKEAAEAIDAQRREIVGTGSAKDYSREVLRILAERFRVRGDARL